MRAERLQEDYEVRGWDLKAALIRAQNAEDLLQRAAVVMADLLKRKGKFVGCHCSILKEGAVCDWCKTMDILAAIESEAQQSSSGKERG